MIGKPIALIRVPNQAVWKPTAACKYLGICRNTLDRFTDEGILKAKWNPHLKRREYDWEELERYRKEERTDYNPTHGENPGVPTERST